jgi:hypothetical protein
MLNPSVADANYDDHTIRRCIGYADMWGYGGLIVANLFAFIATDPKNLLAATDPIGPENNEWIRHLDDRAALTVCAWGNHGAHLDRHKTVLGMLKNPHALIVTKKGFPGHPARLSRLAYPEPYEFKGVS